MAAVKSDVKEKSMRERTDQAARRAQLIFVGLSGLMFMVFTGFGLVFVAEFIPPHDPGLSAGEIAKLYGDNQVSIQAGIVMGLIGNSFLLPLIAAISIAMKKAEGERGYLSLVQAISGSVGVLLFTLPMFFWLIAALRVDRNPESIQLMNDLGWVMLTTPVAPFAIQLISICVCALGDKSERPFLPRWASFTGLWVAVGAIPGCLIPFFTSGSLAWNGLIGFWIPLIVVLAWGMAVSGYFIGRRSNESVVTKNDEDRDLSIQEEVA